MMLPVLNSCKIPILPVTRAALLRRYRCKRQFCFTPALHIYQSLTGEADAVTFV